MCQKTGTLFILFSFANEEATLALFGNGRKINIRTFANDGKTGVLHGFSYRTQSIGALSLLLVLAAIKLSVTDKESEIKIANVRFLVKIIFPRHKNVLVLENKGVSRKDIFIFIRR